jgi:2-methylaconitate cis-trans-isomerase PrpF
MIEIKCSIVRGGTSKGIFIRREELPEDPLKRDQVIKAIFGSPDIRQIDGLGGADVLTSKLAIIGPPTRSDADVDYTFGQVGIDTDIVDYKGNCGNISSAVGPFAIDDGIVQAKDGIATVRIHMTNTGRLLLAEVPVKDGKALVDGNFSIDGVPGAGAKIAMDWYDSAGGLTGKLLPSGNAADVFIIDGKNYRVSLVDAGNPLVFINAASLGMIGTESPAEIEANTELTAVIEKIRGEAAVVFGLCERPEDAAAASPYNPFFAIVSKPAEYTALNGKIIAEDKIDIVSRLLFMLKMHKAYPITGTVATGVAAKIPGSVVWDILGDSSGEKTTLNIGHPSGIVPVEAEVENGSFENGSSEIVLKRVAVYRTARRIMDGIVYVRESVLE